MELLTTYAAPAIALVAAGAAIWSGVSAKKSRVATEEYQRTTALQAQLQYANSALHWRPPMRMEIVEVEYRWSSNANVFEPGAQTSHQEVRENGESLNSLRQKALFVEIVISGTIENKLDDELLLTVHRPKSQKPWYPLQNQRLLILGGQDISNTVLSPSQSTSFTWVDRRSIDNWRELYVATQSRSSSSEELKLPESSARGIRRWLEDSNLEKQRWRHSIQDSFAFGLVAETRMAERIATVWRIEPRRSAIVPVGRDSDGQLMWKLNSGCKEQIDDDVVRFRCHFDSANAQLVRPKVVRLPGRT